MILKRPQYYLQNPGLGGSVGGWGLHQSFYIGAPFKGIPNTLTVTETVDFDLENKHTNGRTDGWTDATKCIVSLLCDAA